MPSLSDYDAWKAKKQRENVGAANVVLSGTEVKPDEAALDQRIADEYAQTTGVVAPPMPLVREYRNVFQQKIEEAKNTTILSRAPRLTEWLRTPDNATVAKDDLAGLSWWETTFNAAGNAFSRGVRRIPQTWDQWLANSAAQRANDFKRGFGEILNDQIGPADVELMNGGNPTGEKVQQAAGPLDFPTAAYRFARSRMSGVFGVDEQQAAANYQLAAGKINKQIGEIPLSPAGTEGRNNWIEAGKDGSLTAYLGAIAKAPGAFAAFAGETAAESIPMMAAAVAATAATRSPVVGAVTMGTLSGAQEYGTAPVEFFAEKKIDVSTPQGAMKAISDPQLMQEAERRGILRGVVVGAMDGLSGGLASKMLAKSHAANMVLQGLLQAGMGSAGEAGAQFASGQEFNLGDILLEGLAEFATAPVEVAGMAGSRFVEGQAKARDATNRVTLFKELSGQARSSKLRERLPEKFRQFVEAATANGPVENVFVPADQFVTYFQNIGVDPHELVDGLEGVTRDDLDAALAGGGDLKIPTSTYAAKIAGSEHDAFLMENMRFDPDDFTSAEAKEFNARADQAMEEAWQIAEDMRRDQEQFRSHEQEIYDTMVSRLRAAGRSTDVATNEAMLWPAFYRVMAQRSNMAIDEFMARYPLPQIVGTIPEGMQFKDVDALTRTLAEARARRSTEPDKRKSLLEFISDYGGIADPGGELRARGAESIKRGRGKKTLRLARPTDTASGDLLGDAGTTKHSVDNVAHAVVEAGYMADDPAVHAYIEAHRNGTEAPDITRAFWEAVDRELRGEQQFSVHDGKAADAAAREADLDQVEAYLASLGVSLEDSDAAIRDAIRAGQENEGQRYGQSDRDKGGRDVPVQQNGDVVPDIVVIADSGPVSTQEAKDAISEFKNDEGQLADGSVVSFTQARKSLFSADISAPLDRRRLIPHLPEIVAAAVPYAQVASDTVKGQNLIFAAAHVRYGDQDMSVRLVLKDVNDGKLRYYQFEGFDIAAAPAGMVPPKGVAKLMPGAATDKDVNSIVADFKEGQRLFQFAGARASTLDRAGLMKAQDMRDQRRSRDAIYEETGFFVGPDGRWRFEISDADAKLWTTKAAHNRLETVFAHKKLFEAYPFLRGVRVSLRIMESVDEVGEYNPDTQQIKVRAKNEAQMLSILLHEIAHAIQQHEGFAFGGNLNMGELYEGDRVEAVKAHAGKLLKSWEEANAGDNPAQADEIALQIQKVHQLLTSEARFSYYRHIAGEVEARNVQHRHELERWVKERGGDNPFKDNPLGIDAPWWTIDVPESKIIVVRSAGHEGYESLSATSPEQGFEPIQQQAGNIAAPNEPRFLFQSGPLSGPRGSIQFPAGGFASGDTVLSLFQNADLSTVVHESGHFFLTVMMDMAAKGEPGSVEHMAGLRDWWRLNAADVAADGMRVMPDVKITKEDVIAALDNGTTGDVLKDAAIDVGMQEQFARGFEAYLMEGKAPSAELQSAFEKFRAWLIAIYRQLRGLNVKINDEVREVFDRMLATDEEIAHAKAMSGETLATFTTAEQLGLSEEQFARLVKLRDQADDDAKARLLREIMGPIKRQREKWFKEERAKVKDETAQQINARSEFRAIEWMGNRRWLGDDQPTDMPDIRLSKSILVDRYGEGILKTLPRGKQTVYTVDGGVDPDEAAGWFGFGSGDEMIRAMETAPARREAIEAETDRVMRERHGDALHDGEIEGLALEAFHNDKRSQVIAAELKAIADVAQVGKTMTAKEARATARAAISRMRVRDAISARRFLAAERKAAEEAARLGAMLARDGVWLGQAKSRMEAKARAAARGDATVDQVNKAIERHNAITESADTTFTVEDYSVTAKNGSQRVVKGGERTSHIAGYNENVAKLIDAKRRQLLNHALYMEAVKVADEVEKAERFIANLNKASKRERIAGAGRRANVQTDYLAAIDEVQDRYDFRRLSGAAEERRGALNAFMEAMRAAGRDNELAIPEKVLADAARKPYKTLPVEELRGVIDTLKNLEHIALRWNDLIDAQNKKKLDEVVTDIVAAFDANVPKRPPGRVATAKEGWRNSVRQFFDLVLNATTLLREIDGFKDGGAAYRGIKEPIDQAMNRLLGRKQKAAADLEDLYSVYSADERRKMTVRQHIPELGFALSKWERIAVALNTGNEGNRQRLTDPNVRGSLTEDQVEAVLATLDERDADFVQSVWDYIGTFRNDIAARERRTTGVEPDWVEASAVTIAGKTLTGGYYPIKYDARLSSLARDDQTQELAQSLQAGRFGKAQTRNGHLKERAESSGRDVELDMSVLHRHVNQVIYDLELSEAVANAWRIIQDQRIRSAFIEAGKQPNFDALELWLKDVAEGELKSADFVGRASRVLKSNFTAAKLAFNFATVALQVIGVFQSSVVVGKRNMAIGIAKAAANPFGVGADIAAKSEFMASRQTTFNKDIFDFYNDPTMGPAMTRWSEFKAEVIGPLSFWLMTKVQFYAADVPTWLAGYEQGLKKFGNDEARAVAHADDIVKRSQASGLFPDRSAIERGSVSRNARQNDVVRLFTTLGSFMFAKFNVAYERSMKANRTIREEGASLKSAQEALSWTADMLFLFTLEAVLGAAIRGQLPKDDDENDTWLKFLMKQTGLSIMSTLPFIRDMGSALDGFGGGGAYGAVAEEFMKPLKQAAQGEADKALVKSVISATGIATGLPATQINRAVDAEWRRREGEDVSPLEYILGKAKK